MRSIMDKILINENIKITDDAKEFILVISNNTCKVLINYIEKFKLLNKLITLEIANNICTNISFIIFQKYTDFILNKNFDKAIEIFLSIHDSGYSVMDILDNYFYFVKTNVLLDESYKYKITSIICKYINNFYNIHEDEIELSLFTNDIINII